MDHSAKQFLLTEIVDYAKLFQSKRNRTRLTARDVHDAIHALGYRPLYSSLGINGDEVVSLPLEDGIPHHTDSAQEKVRVIIADSSQWIPSVISGDNFRPRKVPVHVDAQSMRLGEKTNQYIRRIIECVNEGASWKNLERNQSDVIVASWFLGLHFSDTVSNHESDGVSWQFVRECLCYLEFAIETHKRMRMSEYRLVETDRTSIEYPHSLSATWMIGLDAIATGKATLCDCESETQDRLVRKICDRYIQKFIKQ